MDNKMYQDEFEQFLQDEVKQHRMYPSDHVWKNVRTELHGYRAWPALTFISLFVITALTLTTLLSTQSGRHLVQPANHPDTRMARLEKDAAMSAAAAKTKQYFSSLSPHQVTTRTFASLAETETPAIIAEENTVAFAADNTINATSEKFTAPAYSTAITNELPANQASVVLHVATEQKALLPAGDTHFFTNSTVQPVATITKELPPATVLMSNAADNNPNAETFLKDFKYQLQAVNRKAKFGFQFYFTPSTSYRRLSDQKMKEIIQPAIAAANAPLSQTNTANVNRVVRHRPAVGMEVGFAVLYQFSNRLKFKTGLQLNIRQYQIQTFQSSTVDPTTISLINYRGVENITVYSPYNNNNGYKQTHLDNKLYQVSVPIGLQWDVLQGKHFGVNTEASVQPTFGLNENVYLLSTDYRHYANGNSFLRKWNINTNVGLNITYQSGKTAWQLGPQVRYQHLPTYSNKYPIKEYLLDYGLRIAFTKQLQ